MPPRKYLHYLRSYRKIVGLSQDELAQLLGCQYGSKVSQYEHYRRTPSLATVIAYEIIFQAPLKRLFTGLYGQVREQLESRAKSLLPKVERSAAPRDGTRAFLRALAQVRHLKPRRA